MSPVLSALLAFAARSALADGPYTCDGGEGEGEVASLLQKNRLQRVGLEKPPGSGSVKAIAFEGGGWLAQFAPMGLLIGLAASSAPERPVTSLLEGFDMLSGTSGGSWLATSMIYSGSYVAWMDELEGASAEQIPAIFNQYAMKLNTSLPGCSATELASYISKLVSRLLRYGYVIPPSVLDYFSVSLLDGEGQEVSKNAHASAGISDDMTDLWDNLMHYKTRAEQTCAVFRGDWAPTVQTMFSATADISPEATLAGKHNKWAEGKDLIATVTLPMRSEKDTGYYPKTANNYVEYNGPFVSAVKYEPVGDHVQYMPAKISFKIGSPGGKAPYPFCGDTECAGIKYRYTGGSRNQYDVPLAAVFKQQFDDLAGGLSVSAVAAASSSFDGKATLARSRKGAPVVVTGDAATWAAPSDKGGAFHGGSIHDELPGMRLAAQTELAARAPLFAFTDGGDTDLTGMIQAVASGADTVVSVQIAHAKGGLPDTFDMFEEGGRNGVGRVFSAEAEQLWSLYNDTGNWMLFTPPADEKEPSGLLKIVRFEKNLTTVENKFFGIRPHRQVRVVFVFVSTDPGIIDIAPPFNTFQQYGLLIRDIVALLRSNREFAQNLASKFAA